MDTELVCELLIKKRISIYTSSFPQICAYDFLKMVKLMRKNDDLLKNSHKMFLEIIDQKGIKEEEMLKEFDSYRYSKDKDIRQLEDDLKKMFSLEGEVCKIREELKSHSFSEIYDSECDKYLSYVFGTPC